MVDNATVTGAIASVALSHPDGCACYICRAATGDMIAYQRVLDDLEKLEEEEPKA